MSPELKQLELNKKVDKETAENLIQELSKTAEILKASIQKHSKTD